MVSSSRGNAISSTALAYWRSAQVLLWLAGAAIFLLLLVAPQTGLLLFWNVLIPVAPALLLIVPGLWRNVCPLATTTLLPRHFGWSAKKQMSRSLQRWLSFVAVVALFVIVPLRHPVFNSNANATAALLAGATLIGVGMGLFFDWKSGWCSSLCPIHPVEKLYGASTVKALSNAHCTSCVDCVVPCPDSRRLSIEMNRTRMEQLTEWLLTGGLPGFIWGWFQPLRSDDLLLAYQWPLVGMCVTLLIYGTWWLLHRDSFNRNVRQVAAFACIAVYYGYRIPSLVGFSTQGADGTLIDLNGRIPFAAPLVVAAAVTLFFLYWIFVRQPSGKGWLIRPPRI